MYVILVNKLIDKQPKLTSEARQPLPHFLPRSLLAVTDFVQNQLVILIGKLGKSYQKIPKSHYP